MKQRTADLHFARGGRAKLVRVDQPEVAHRPRKLEPRITQRLEADVARAEQLLLLSGEKPEPLDPKPVALELPDQLALFIGHTDRRQIESRAGEVEPTGCPRCLDASTDSCVGSKPPAQPFGDIGRQQW